MLSRFCVSYTLQMSYPILLRELAPVLHSSLLSMKDIFYTSLVQAFLPPTIYFSFMLYINPVNFRRLFVTVTHLGAQQLMTYDARSISSANAGGSRDRGRCGTEVLAPDGNDASL